MRVLQTPATPGGELCLALLIEALAERVAKRKAVK
jgi:hypothetical protein